MSFPIFTYGTLRKGEDLHDYYLRHASYLGPAELEDANLYNCWDVKPNNHDDRKVWNYPVLVTGFDARGDHANLVHGELYVVNERTFAQLLSMEVGCGYNAEWLDVYQPNKYGGEYVNALVFTWPDDREHGKPVPFNDWTRREENA